MTLLEKEAVQFAESLDDYEHVWVSDIGGGGPDRYWLTVRDHRFDVQYEIASHADYWDIIGALVTHALLFTHGEGGGVMELQRFGVTATIFVEATAEEEAMLIVERFLAGRFDLDLVSAVETNGGAS